MLETGKRSSSSSAVLGIVGMTLQTGSNYSSMTDPDVK